MSSSCHRRAARRAVLRPKSRFEDMAGASVRRLICAKVPRKPCFLLRNEIDTWTGLGLGGRPGGRRSRPQKGRIKLAGKRKTVVRFIVRGRTIDAILVTLLFLLVCSALLPRGRSCVGGSRGRRGRMIRRGRMGRMPFTVRPK